MSEISFGPEEFLFQQGLKQADDLPVEVVDGCRKEQEGNDDPSEVIGDQDARISFSTT